MIKQRRGFLCLWPFDFQFLKFFSCDISEDNLSSVRLDNARRLCSLSSGGLNLLNMPKGATFWPLGPFDK